MLNLGFTIGSFVLSATTLPLGILMDRFGPRPTRLVGSASFAASCALMALASRDTRVLSPLIFLALSLNGFGGICLTVRVLQLTGTASRPQLPNMFGNLRSTFMALMIGSYASSAITFPGIKVLDLFGAGDQHSVPLISLGSTTFPVTFPSPALERLVALVQGHEVPGFPSRGLTHWHRIPISSQPTWVGRPWAALFAHMRTRPRSQLSSLGTPVKGAPSAVSPESVPFRQSLCSPIFLWSLLTMGMTQLRVIFYMAAMNKMLEYLVTGGQEHETDILRKWAAETVGFYSSIFGAMQLLCLLTCPLIGYIMDWRIKDCVDVPTEGSALGNARGWRHLLGHKSFSVTPWLPALFLRKSQRLCYGLTGPTRSSCPLPHPGPCLLSSPPFPLLSLCCGLFISQKPQNSLPPDSCRAHSYLTFSRFPSNHFGTLTGLQSLISAVFALLQQPLFMAMVGPLKGEPFWVNLGLLLFSLLGFLLPSYLFYYRAQLQREYATNWEGPKKVLGSSEVTA
ncbi:large neutral amino acids [Lynx pardinus]|nr:large neutral amino acids [Lynx pardinus]